MKITLDAVLFGANPIAGMNGRMLSLHPIPLNRTVITSLPIPPTGSGTANWHCKRCDKYYWEGSHWERIKGFIEDLD